MELWGDMDTHRFDGHGDMDTHRFDGNNMDTH